MTRNSGGARRGDPFTSHDAAESIDATRLERIVYEAILSEGWHGATWDELHHKVPFIAKASISPRFAPLRRKKFIRPHFSLDKEGNEIPVKRTGDSKRGQIVWVARGVRKP